MFFQRAANILDSSIGKKTQQLISKTSEQISASYPKTGYVVGEVTSAVVGASIQSIKFVSTLADTTTGTGIHLVTKDKMKLEQDKQQIKALGSQVIKGVGANVRITYQGVSNTVKGVISSDQQQIVYGVTSLTKQVAVVLFAYGTFEILQDTITGETIILDTRNNHLVNLAHQETNVQFVTREIELTDGSEIVGVFADFPTEFEVELPDDMYLASDQVHNALANKQLFQEVMNNPLLADRLELTPLDKELLYQGQTPTGYTWHHSENPGILQLVDQDIHANTGHTGGRELWGGGEEFRV